ncbi:MAG: ribonuclease HI family protein [Nitrospirae bacterium]|nr:ribonuclease HI family protein [Nitrospirota bacterium]
MADAKIFCDGASSGNPGQSGIGIVIQFGGAEGRHQVNRSISEHIGVATNNIAEYSALIRGLEEARSMGAKKIEIFLDSELLVKQIKGIYKIKSDTLRPLWERSTDILRQFDNYRITHIRRELNKEADALAKKAVRQNGKTK